MERFWEKVDRKGPDECWEWTGARNNYNYGNFYYHGKYMAAHRVAIELEGSDIPSGMFVCHTCDNPPCVNPSHLFVGEPKANTQDMMGKGRHNPPLGEKCGHAVLIDEDIRRIREAHLFGASQKDLADIYGVRQCNISRIINRKRWAHVE